MLAICSVVIGILCLPHEYAQIAEQNAMYFEVDKNGNRKWYRHPKAVVRTGISIDYNISDNLMEIVSTTMSKSCVGDWCLFYRKHCNISYTVCAYTFGGAVRRDHANRHLDMCSGTSMMVTARSGSIMRRAELRISLLISNSRETRRREHLLLASMESSGTADPVLCSRGGLTWFQGCPYPTLECYKARRFLDMRSKPDAEVNRVCHESAVGQ